MDTTIETFEHAGLTVRIGWEDYAEPFNPRQYDNLGIMVCWHPDYVLGDEQIRNLEGRGAVEHEAEHSGRFRSIGTLARWASVAERAPAVLPLYLYDHSGISMSAGAGLVLGETPSGGVDEFGSPRGWDTTLCGVIYTTPERIRALCGEPVREGDAVYCPPDWEGTAEQWIAKQLRAEVEVYDQYLRGEIYWYAVEDAEGEYLDSCGGFLGGGVDADGREIDSLDYVRQEAREAAEGERARLDEAAATEARERAYWAARGIATAAEGA
jgi:hypothetical protein